ncbi:MAG TPA: response regulator [Polyangiaceae bacterium]|nr:response regulator [Polyangiaceae bacterium]
MTEDAEQLNVLVIDDDPALRQMLAHVLSAGNHQVVLAASAEEALELLVHWTFQVALIDHNLPGMEGLILGEYLRRNNPDMSIVMVTGSDDPSIRRRSRESSLGFLAKPFQVRDILRIIDEYVLAAKERDLARKQQQDVLFSPPIEAFADELTELFSVPNVPDRVGDSIVQTLKRSLNNLKSAARYTERDRVVALSGLLTAQVLGVDLPRTKSGITLFEEYDRLMLERGRRTEFSSAPASRRHRMQPAG